MDDRRLTVRATVAAKFVPRLLSQEQQRFRYEAAGRPAPNL